MSDDATIDALDPLLIDFTLQHDFRERFFHALQMIVEVIDTDGDEFSVEQRLAKVDLIAREALDHDSISLWMKANRPMPWLDDVIGEDAKQITEMVRKALDLDS